MNQTLKAVVVGCGGISDAWFTPAVKRDDLQIVGLVDLNAEAAEAKARQHNLDAIIGTELSSVIKATGADVVFDCTVPEAHRNVTVSALEHGCHVLGEKPMADTMENARQMVDAAARAGRTYAVIQNRRYLPEIRAVRDFLGSGKLGRVTTVQSNFFLGAHFGGFRDVMDHVLILDMAIHTFDAARYLLGLDANHVYCHEWNPSGSWYANGASALALFEMEDDVVYTYQGSWCAEGLPTTWEADWHVICENGSLHWNGGDQITAEVVTGSGEFRSETGPVAVTIPPLPKVETGHAGLIGDFVRAVTSGTEPMTVCSDNIRSLAMVHGAIRSAEAGSRVAIER